MRTPSEVAKEAVEYFGHETQINIAIEECSELIQALCHIRRSKCSREHVMKEIADVYLILESLKHIFDSEWIDLNLKIKTKRLEETLRDYKRVSQ